jgi:methionyl-tRNA formyltransferase
MIKDKIIFFGATKFSEEILINLLNDNCNISAIFSIPKKFNISYSDEKVVNYNYADLSKYANKLSIPFYLVDSSDEKKLIDYKSIIESLSPKVIIAVGWYYMVPKQIRKIPENGVWGIHASLLPNYAGGAPLVWAIINGEKETGVTLFKFDSGVDDGDIIFQEKIKINKKDTIKILSKKVSSLSKKIIKKALNQNKVIYFPQDKSKIKVYPQRSPKDGKIDWSWDSQAINNFIRAQTKPYPGAWTIIDGHKVTIWDAEITKINE